MLKELDTDEVYLFDGGDGDAEMIQIKEGSAFGPFVYLEVTSGMGETGFMGVRSPDTAARLALALMARMDSDEESRDYAAVMEMLASLIKEEEAKRDFKIGERVEVFDATYGDLDWLSATVLEYPRHGGYLVRNYWGDINIYSPANIRKARQNG